MSKFGAPDEGSHIVEYGELSTARFVPRDRNGTEFKAGDFVVITTATAADGLVWRVNDKWWDRYVELSRYATPAEVAAGITNHNVLCSCEPGALVKINGLQNFPFTYSDSDYREAFRARKEGVSDSDPDTSQTVEQPESETEPKADNIHLHVLQEIPHDQVKDGDAVVVTFGYPPIFVKLPEQELKPAEPEAADGKTADEKAEKPEPVAKDRNDNRLKAGDILAYTDADGIDFKRLIAIADENNKITTSRLDCRGCTIGVDAKDYVLWQRAEGN